MFTTRLKIRNLQAHSELHISISFKGIKFRNTSNDVDVRIYVCTCTTYSADLQVVLLAGDDSHVKLVWRAKF